MKATEIKLTYEGIDSKGLHAWIGASFSIDDENLVDAFLEAKKQLKESYEAIKCESYSPVKQRELLTMTHPKLHGVISAMMNGDADINRVQESFVISKEVFNLMNREGIL